MTRSTFRTFALITTAVILTVFAAAGPVSGEAESPLGEPGSPVFSKTFLPSTIGPGATSILSFTIANASPDPATGLAFTDSLPAGVALATPANAVSTCGGIVSAPSGGNTISLSGGVVPGFTACAVTVATTSSVPGTHTNVSGDLTSTAGNSGTATADLTVATDRPGFSKSFTPTTISFGGRSTLTFLIDNSANGSSAINPTFVDVLPPGLVVADPALASTTCPDASVTAVPGSGNISLAPSFPATSIVPAGGTCEVSVDVIGGVVGTAVNLSGELTSSAGGPTQSSGLATASLVVTTSTIFAVKSFTDDPVAPGDTVTLEFTVTNNDRSLAATNVALTDDLDATLSGLVATGLPVADVCGAGSQLDGTDLLSLTGGSLAPASSCTFSVSLQVPPAAAAGVYPNTTSSVTADLGGSPVTGGAATDILLVSDAPILTKTFLTDPVGAGASTTLQFTVTNTSGTSAVTDITFTDNLSAFLSGLTVTSLPPAGSCGAGSTFFTNFVGGDLYLNAIGGNLAAGGSCTFGIDLQLPTGGAPGTFINSTSPIAAVVGGAPQLGASATDSLTVVTAPRLAKTFIDDPVAPGGTATLEFTLTHDLANPADATAIAFSDDLGATLAGLTAVGLPLNDVCGVGSQISGTTNLALSGGTLAPGSSCTFSVTLQVPAAALPGLYLNTTSGVVATVEGVSTANNPAQDDLQISGLSFSKSFTDDPVIPGDTVTLEFTIDNTSASLDATGMFFTDNLTSTLTGLTATNLPLNDICGPGSSITGPSLLVFTGGNLTAGTSCAFSVDLLVPAAAVPNTYGNTTSGLTVTIGGSTIDLPPASDQLVVDDTLLELTKEFTDDPVAPGDTVTLEFTVTNLDAVDTVTGITFTDDLGAALSGLTALGLPIDNVCGADSQLAGTGLLTLTGGSLPAGGSCTFGVTLQVPAAVPLGTTATNTTSQANGSVRGLPITGGPASDDLRIDSIDFTKAFDGPVGAGGTAVLSFVIDNLDAVNGVTGLAFSDDLDAVLPGLVGTGLPMNDVCGSGSQISGTSFLTLTGATLLPSGSCTINVTVQVPAAAAPGIYPNVTSGLFSAGLPAGSPATADLVIEPPPIFAKTFTPALILTGGSSTLDFTIDNTAAAVAAGSLDFTDNLPAGTVVATPANASTTCTGGTLTAVSGSGVVSYTGGSVAAGTSCTVSVDVAGLAPGALINTTGALTSSLGNSGTASATLSVAEGAFGLSKNFLSAPVLGGGTVVLEFTLTNQSSVSALTNISFTDDLNAVVPGLAAVGLPQSDVCGAGSQLSGTSALSLTGGNLAAAASCVFTATIVVPPGAPLGSFVNTTSPVSALAGGLPVSASAATDTIQIAYFAFDKAFLGPGLPGGTVDLEFSIANPDPANGAAGIGFTDNLDAALPGMTAVGLPAVGVCGAGSQISGTSVLTLTGGNLSAGAPCSFTVTLQIPNGVPGSTYLNTTSVLDATVGGSSVAGDPGSEATATLTIDDSPPLFTKAFTPSAIQIGGFSTLNFTIDNALSGSDATNLDFTDNLPAGMVVATPPNASTTCIGGTLNAVSGSGVVFYTGGTVPAGAACTVSVVVEGNDPGALVNLSGDLTSSIGSSGSASATLTVVEGNFSLSKSFLSAPVLRGGAVTLEFTLTNVSAVSALTDISFTDDLNAVIPGLAAIGLPAIDICGPGSQFQGTSGLSLVNGSLAPLESCSFSATVVVPPDAPIGTFINTTSTMVANAGGVPVSGAAATAELETGFFSFDKAFVGSARPGGTVELEFAIFNPDPSNAATGIGFTDDLNAVITGLTAVGLPEPDVCGPGSQIDGTSVLGLTGGNLGPGESCVFAVTLQIPGGTPNGSYTNLTSVLGALVGGNQVTGDAGSEAFAVLDLGVVPAIPDLNPMGALAFTVLMAMIGLWILRLRQ